MGGKNIPFRGNSKCENAGSSLRREKREAVLEKGWEVRLEREARDHLLKKRGQGLSWQSVVKTALLHCRGHGLNPWLGILHGPRHDQKINKSIKIKCTIPFII